MQESPTKEMKFDVSTVNIPFEKPKVKMVLKPGEPAKHVYTTVLETYPALKSIKSFPMYNEESTVGLSGDMVIRYIIMLYSEDSILNKKPLAPLEDRKLQALDLAGFKRKLNDEYDETVIDSLCLLNEDIVVSMIMGYLEYLHSDIWTEINILEQELSEFRRVRMTPISTEKDTDLMTASNNKNKLGGHCDTILEKLKKYKDIFYGDNTDLKAKSKKKRVTLESIANSQ